MSKKCIKYAYIFALIFYLILLFFNLNFSSFSYAENDPKIVKYNGPIYHLFTHCLIADTSVAFAKNNPMRKHYDTDCLTVFEFQNILRELYENDYILIKANSIFDPAKTYGTKKTLYLPEGKKPVILSFDDVNYDRKKSGKGMVDKIALDQDGKIVTYTNAIQEPSYNNEFITILEDFVSRHPDFSFMGAKGLICLTGYDGILGYRTNQDSPDKESEIAAVKPVIARLKDLGWEFASHSYGHYHMKKISFEKFKEDANKWKSEVESLVGKTAIYVYPYGEREILDSDGNLSAKHQYLEKMGFRLFCGVGVKSYFSYLPNPLNKKILFMDRTPLDGYTLQNNYTALSHLFDIKKVYDNDRDIKLEDFCI